MSNETELEKSRRHVQEGGLRISRHHEVMAELRAEGQPTEIAELILAEFEKIQAESLSDLGRLVILAEFGRFGNTSSPGKEAAE